MNSRRPLETLLEQAFPLPDEGVRSLYTYVANASAISSQAVYMAVERSQMSAAVALAILRGSRRVGGSMAAADLAPFLHAETFEAYRALARAGLFEEGET